MDYGQKELLVGMIMEFEELFYKTSINWDTWPVQIDWKPVSKILCFRYHPVPKINNISQYIIIKQDEKKSYPRNFKRRYCFIVWSLLASQIRSKFCPIPALYAKIPAFCSDICPPSATVGFLHSLPWRERARSTIEGGEGHAKLL